MALTQTAEYALRAVVWLAQHTGQPQTTRQIADATQVPSSYLPKVFHPLVRAGLVGGQRGLRGGYSLLKEPSDITLLDVVQQVDPVQHIAACPLDLASHRGRLCPLHSLLERLIVAEEETLRATHLSDLIGQPGQLTPLCDALAVLACGRAAALGRPPHGNVPVGPFPRSTSPTPHDQAGPAPADGPPFDGTTR